MKQYISKATVVAEIEKRRDAALMRQKNLEAIGQVTVLDEMIANQLNGIISFINNLKVINSQKKNIYVVTRCEEHSDYVEKVFFDKEKAEHYCKQFEGNEDAYGRDITEIEVDYPPFEVKEGNSEKELSYDDYMGFFEKHPNFPDNWGFAEAWIFAKHFYELGFASQLIWQDIRLISEIGEEFMNSDESDNCTDDETYYSAILNKLKQLGRDYKTQRQKIRELKEAQKGE